MNQKNIALRKGFSARNRRAIVAAAEYRFATFGYAGSSVAQICLDAGVNVALVSYYFHSKEGLLKAVLEKGLMARRTRTHFEVGCVSDAKALAKQLRGFALELLKISHGNIHFYRLLRREAASHPLVRKAHDEIYEAAVIFVNRFFSEAKRLSLIRPETDVLVIEQMVISLLIIPDLSLHERLRPANELPSKGAALAYVDAVLTMLASGVLRDPGPLPKC